MVEIMKVCGLKDGLMIGVHLSIYIVICWFSGTAKTLLSLFFEHTIQW